MARQTKGRIYKSGKKGAFHLQYYVNGKEFKVTLKDGNGNAITNEGDAVKAAEKVLHPVKAKTQADQLQQILEAVETAEAKAKRLQEKQEREAALALEAEEDAQVTLKTGWTLFMQNPKRPSSCKRYGTDFPRHSTMGNYKGYWDKFAGWMKVRRPKDQRLSAITPEDASAFMDTIQSEYSSGTFNKYLQFLNLFFDLLNGAGKLKTTNPFRNVDRMENRYHSKRPLSVEQIAKLIDNATGEMRILIALGYFTGLRFGDCCTLLWQEVDLLRGIIERVPRKTEHTVKDIQQGIVKVGIPPYLSTMLAEIPSERRTGYVLPGFAEQYLTNNASANRALLEHFRECGISTTKPGTGTPEVRNEKGKVIQKAVRAVVEVGFHSLRYSYISHNAEAGTPAAVIQRNAGHSNPAMTEHYTRISDRAAVEYAKALSLPMSATGDVIDVQTAPEPEREALHRLADTLDIEQIREILNNYRRV